MTIPGAKTKTIWMPGQERPAASRLRIQRPPTTQHLLRNTGRNTKPSDGQPVGQTAEGLDYRFLRSQLRVIGPGSLRKTRLRRSEYNLNTHPHHSNIERCFNNRIRTLQSHSDAR